MHTLLQRQIQTTYRTTKWRKSSIHLMIRHRRVWTILFTNHTQNYSNYREDHGIWLPKTPNQVPQILFNPAKAHIADISENLFTILT
jgi:hypothetical protein